MPDLIRALQGIRGNPLLSKLVPGFRRDDVWIPAFAGMTTLRHIVAIVLTFSDSRRFVKNYS